IQRVLKPHSAYIALVGHSVAWKGRSFALAVTHKRCVLVELPQPRSIDTLRTALFEAMKNNRVIDYAQAAAGIYEKSLQPVLGRLDSGITELILSVNGVYSDIPFDALVNKQPGVKCDFTTLPYLMDQYTIRYTLSATQLVQHKTTTHSFTRLNIFTPGFDSHSALVFSERNAKTLQQRYAGTWFSGSRATTSQFLNALGEHNIVHLASHAHVNPDDADASSLIFQGANGEERLFLHQLLGVRVRAPLVVVAACETAAGKEQYAEGSRTFTRSLLFAGAESTIGTLWRVDDKSTAALLARFYEALSKGQGTAEALRSARKHYRLTCASPEAANPFFWAGLVLTGTDQALSLSRNDLLWPYWLIAAGGVALVIVWRVVKKRRGCHPIYANSIYHNSL
ncbi:MAG: CHAT domain-containing protein, partial [Bacteroidota bacterium]